MKIYTRGGDRGETGLIGGARVRKSALRVAAYGEVDELNAALGVAAAELASGKASSHRQALVDIQRTLFDLGAELATPPGGERSSGAPPITGEQVSALEKAIDGLTEGLPPLRHFILPGGAGSGACVHLARAVCRRAERAVVALVAAEPVRPEVLAYLNRLSDYLFVLARAINVEAGFTEVIWPGRDKDKSEG